MTIIIVGVQDLCLYTNIFPIQIFEVSSGFTNGVIFLNNFKRIGGAGKIYLLLLSRKLTFFYNNYL